MSHSLSHLARSGVAIALVVLTSACDVLRSMTETTAPAPVQPSPAIRRSAPPSSTPTAPPIIVGNPFERAVSKAASATDRTRSAVTREDWDLIILLWQQAIALLNQVPRSSPNWAVAQKLLPEYQQGLQNARQLAKRGIPSTPIAVNKQAQNDTLLIVGSEPSPKPSAAPQDAASSITTLNQQQTAFFAKQKRFAVNLAELRSNLAADTPTYVYNTTTLQPNQAISTAVAKQDGLVSYTGAVFVIKNEKNQEITVAAICVTQKPSKNPPAVPQLKGKDIQCPTGMDLVKT
ncbi:MAG: hypothetical protein HC866_04745 [Leptolyngbyaceae cyanobacterium RU_5_1]|nr:hypothetical protein [Leptolyngbyaceae cyanobacterium RU_5_1]